MSESRLQQLRQLAPSQILPNPENPRLVFRQDEMESLMLSIDQHGIQVPITVYKEGDHFRLLDGERRWRCATKLNLKTVPAIVQEQPTALQNLILMYNIHALREQWDYYTIASKLERIIDLYEGEHGEVPNEIILSNLTGPTRGAIRRCHLLIDLPEKFKRLLEVELERPKPQQRLSEDLFIEMEKSLRAVVRRMPEYAPRTEEIRDTLVEKYRSRTIGAVTDFRQLSKIATAVEKLGVARQTAKRAIDRVFDPNDEVGIKQAYSDTVEFEYGEKRAIQNASSLMVFIRDVVTRRKERDLSDEVKRELAELLKLLQRLV